jgi:arabinan endo-1,5-alpha-L-arabinosidase
VLAEASRADNNVIVAADARWIAPGLDAIVKDKAGQHWIVYHAVDAQRLRAKDTDDINSRRVMLVKRLAWVDGWPLVVR